MPIRELSTLGLGELLGALLSAVVDGQQRASASSLAMIEQVGLVQEGTDERFRTVTIRYSKLDENQQPADYVLEVPLLAMVAIPTLTVSQARIAFSYDVVETTTDAPEENTPDAAPGRTLLLPDVAVRPLSLRGFVERRSVTQDSRETTGIDVEVTVESTPLPVGLERLLELTELTTSKPVDEDDG